MVNVYRHTSSATRWCPAGTAATSPGERAGRAIVAEYPRDSVHSDATTAGAVQTR